MIRHCASKRCEECLHCLYICEGDYICDADAEPEMVISDFTPTDSYMKCGGKEWKEN